MIESAIESKHIEIAASILTHEAAPVVATMDACPEGGEAKQAIGAFSEFVDSVFPDEGDVGSTVRDLALLQWRQDVEH